MDTGVPSNEFVVLVCGGRDYARPRINGELIVNEQEYKYVTEILDSVLEACRATGKSLRIIHGDAAGADSAADMWAQSREIPVRRFPAKWKTFGPGAGPLRNKQMLEEGKPQAVVAFPGGKGTNNMIEQARRARVPVKECRGV